MIKFKENITQWVVGSIAFCAWLMCFKMISPGYVGVIVNLFGDQKGIDSKELHVGMHWIAPWKKVHKFPIFEQNHTWEGTGKADSWGFVSQTKDGMPFWADIGITFHLDPSKVSHLFVKYRRGIYEITHDFVRNYIRDAINMAASKLTIQDLYGSEKESFLHTVESDVRAQLVPMGIEIGRIYLIGRLEFPETIKTALNAKIEATQRAQQRENELRETEAEVKKRLAKADGEARVQIMQAEAESMSNSMISHSITPQLIEWQRVQKWDGKLPTVSGAGNPMIMMDR